MTLSGFNYAEFLIVNLEVILRHVHISLSYWKIDSTLSSATFSFSCGLWDKKFIQVVSNLSASSVTEFPLLFFNSLTKSLLSSLVPFFSLTTFIVVVLISMLLCCFFSFSLRRQTLSIFFLSSYLHVSFLAGPCKLLSYFCICTTEFLLNPKLPEPSKSIFCCKCYTRLLQSSSPISSLELSPTASLLLTQKSAICTGFLRFGVNPDVSSSDAAIFTGTPMCSTCSGSG